MRISIYFLARFLLPHSALVPAGLPVPLPHAGLGGLPLPLAQRLVLLLVQQGRVEPGEGRGEKRRRKGRRGRRKLGVRSAPVQLRVGPVVCLHVVTEQVLPVPLVLDLCVLNTTRFVFILRFVKMI